MLEIPIMALQNIRRRLLRNLLTISGLAVFVVIFALVSSITLTLQTSVTESVSDLGGEIMIWNEGAIVPFLGNIPENYTNIVEKIENVNHVVPQITGISRVGSSDFRVVIGINPSDIPVLYTYTMIEGDMPSSNESKAALGYLFATDIEKHVGDNVTIERQTLTVVGIFKTNTWLDTVVIVPLERAQTIFPLTGRISVIIVTVTEPSKIDSVIDEIKSQVSGVSVFASQEATTRLAPLMSSISWLSYILFTITGIACLFGIGNVMLTGIFERTREIGILKALGAKSSDVAKMIIYESTIMGTFGGLLGCSISSILLIQGLLIPITSSAAFRILFFPEILIYGLAISIAISIFAAGYPLWRAVHVRPNEVLKFG